MYIALELLQKCQKPLKMTDKLFITALILELWGSS